MTITLENPLLQLTLDPAARAGWSLNGGKDGSPLVHGAWFGASTYAGNRLVRATLPLSEAEISEHQVVHSPHGLLNQLQIRFGKEQNGLVYSVDFALPEGKPMLLWRFKAENNSRVPVHINSLELFKAGRLDFPVDSKEPSQELAFLSNGWQSWSYSGVYGKQERQRRTRLWFLQEPTNANPETRRTRRAGHFSSDMFAVLGERKSRVAFVVGFLSQRQHFGSLEAWADPSGFGLLMSANGDQARLDSGTEISTDWACLAMVEPDEADPLGIYVEAVAQEHNLKAFSSKSPTGWCSWYHFFQNITPAAIRSNLAVVQQMQADLPLELVQIDDGFEAQVGDWLSFHPNFPEGVAPLSAEIREAGMVPGLWLAPFIVHPKSKLMEAHPDWLLRGHLNRPVNAGFLWNTFTTALDLTQPEVQAYVREVIHTAAQHWGFSYLKLDFLFAAALPGKRHDPTRTRAQVLRAALEDVRLAAGTETGLLGCGCPLGSAIGLVDAMRISSDVDVGWTPAFRGRKLFLQAEPHMPAVRNALQNVLSRASLHRRWWINDPDCLLLRPEINLTLDEIHTQASVIALSGGSLFLSDHLPSLPPERLRIAQSLLPLMGQAPHIPDWLDRHTPRRLRLDLGNSSGKWHLLALINWEDEAQALQLDLAGYGLDPSCRYYAREFWRGASDIFDDGIFYLGSLPAHGTALCAVRPLADDTPQYLGSELHISQGLEVISWEVLPHSLRFSIQRPGHIRGKIWIRMLRQPEQVTCNGAHAPYELIGEICCLQLEAHQTALIQINW
jgi:alpha-galactosidase